jgi:hypothetical protein
MKSSVIHKKYRNMGGKKIIAQVCHMRMRKINPFLFSAPCTRGIKGDYWIGWVGGELGVCPSLSLALV